MMFTDADLKADADEAANQYRAIAAALQAEVTYNHTWRVHAEHATATAHTPIARATAGVDAEKWAKRHADAQAALRTHNATDIATWWETHTPK